MTRFHCRKKALVQRNKGTSLSSLLLDGSAGHEHLFRGAWKAVNAELSPTIVNRWIECEAACCFGFLGVYDLPDVIGEDPSFSTLSTHVSRSRSETSIKALLLPEDDSLRSCKQAVVSL